MKWKSAQRQNEGETSQAAGQVWQYDLPVLLGSGYLDSMQCATQSAPMHLSSEPFQIVKLAAQVAGSIRRSED